MRTLSQPAVCGCKFAAWQGAGAITLTWVIITCICPSCWEFGFPKQLAVELILENALAVVMEPLMGVQIRPSAGWEVSFRLSQ